MRWTTFNITNIHNADQMEGIGILFSGGQFLPLPILELMGGFRISELTDGRWWRDFSDKMNPLLPQNLMML